MVVRVGKEDIAGTVERQSRSMGDYMVADKGQQVVRHVVQVEMFRSPQLGGLRMLPEVVRKWSHSVRYPVSWQKHEEDEWHLHMHQGFVPWGSAPRLLEECCHRCHHSQPVPPFSLCALRVVSLNRQAIQTLAS